jgi:hypothetical protein
LRRSDPFLALYNEKIDLFIFSILLRISFFIAAFCRIVFFNNEMVDVALEKVMLGLAMIMSLSWCEGRLDKPIEEIKEDYTKEEIQESYNTYKMRINRFFNTRFYLDMLWFSICILFFFESKAMYNLYLLTIPVILFFYYLVVTLETATINSTLRVGLNPIYFRENAANCLSFGMYYKERDKHDD